MRQVGSLPDETTARRFTAYLITKNIPATAERDRDQWLVWSRDENDLVTAKQELEKFRIDPANATYDGVEQQAETLQREEIKRSQEIRKNVVEMRGKWGRPGAIAGRKRPLTITLIVISIAVSLFTNFSKSPPNSTGGMTASRLSFVEKQTYIQDKDALHQIKRGEIWRLITPIFLHLGPLHLVFNMVWLYQLGGIIEWKRGATFLVILVIATAIISNIAQALVPEDLIKTKVIEFGGYPFFGGMSGVVYAMFGYVWFKSKTDPAWGVRLNQNTVIIMMVWLFICMYPGMGVANVAHVVGLLAGIGLVYVPWPETPAKK